MTLEQPTANKSLKRAALTRHRLAQPFDKKSMMLRAILAFLALPTLVAGVFPWLISKLPATDNFQWPYGVVLIVLGGGILLASVISFYRHGRGTLAPWDPPKYLVVQDLYRFNRNPMYVGVGLLTLGWALCTGNPWNYAYSVLVLVIFHLRVVLYEEREMERLFGREWAAYCSKVPRWGLVLHPYTPNVEPSGAPNGSQPIRSETNRTSSATGSRR